MDLLGVVSAVTCQLIGNHGQVEGRHALDDP